MASILSQCSLDVLQKAAENLKSGGLVAFPTETVYGLGVDAENKEAVHRMYQVKDRPFDHPVIVHIADLDDVDYWATDIPDYAIALMRDYWPGPMTLILKRTGAAGDFITGNQDYVGLRMPAHTVALNLLKEFKKVGGHGLAAPSANRFGAVSPTTALAVESEIKDYLEARDMIVDGGPCLVGVESTIIDCTTDGPKILRPGAITEEMVAHSTQLRVVGDEKAIRVSGSLEQHYSPKARVCVDVAPGVGDGLIALSDHLTPEGVIRLASPQTIEEYARILYTALREADTQGLSSVSVYLPTGDGLAVAIRDRVMRSAAKA